MTRRGFSWSATLFVALAVSSCSSGSAASPASSDAAVSSAPSMSTDDSPPSTEQDGMDDAESTSVPDREVSEQSSPADVSIETSTTTAAMDQADDTVDVVVSGVGVSVVRRNGNVEPVSVAEASLRLTTPTFTEYQLMTDVSASDGYPMVLVDDQGQVGPPGKRYLLSGARLYETGVVDTGPAARPDGTPGGRTGSADPSAEDSVIAALRAVPGVAAVERVAPGVLRVEVEP